MYVCVCVCSYCVLKVKGACRCNLVVSVCVCSSLVQANPDVAMDCIVHMSQNLSPSQRAKITHLLASMDTT